MPGCLLAVQHNTMNLSIVFRKAFAARNCMSELRPKMQSAQLFQSIFGSRRKLYRQRRGHDQPDQGQPTHSKRKIIKQVKYFKHLGSRVDNRLSDLDIRKAQVWAAARKLQNTWKTASQGNSTFVRPTVEIILLFGSQN